MSMSCGALGSILQKQQQMEMTTSAIRMITSGPKYTFDSEKFGFLGFVLGLDGSM